ncbi:hypothetical protein CC78DRAFT_578619 [Lojkania enalia]|uniref:DUF7730 domain-containing protein n=1 Tax=Lojkania enalia TaxID=147567 RepID=A0A9P4KC91_9PLEO|nr:hypothetical protein CC78DRAFT_578619 [Didymosphaeria enalia]
MNSLKFTETVKASCQENGLLGLYSTPENLVIIIKQNSSSALLSLPAELREMIWKLVLGDLEVEILYERRPGSKRRQLFGQAIEDFAACYLSGRPLPFLSYFTKLMSLCRQIYYEASTLPYALNKFNFYTTRGIDKWLSKRLPGQLATIRHISLPGEFMERYIDQESERLRDTMTSLTRVVVRITSFDALSWLQPYRERGFNIEEVVETLRSKMAKREGKEVSVEIHRLPFRFEPVPEHLSKVFGAGAI